MNPKRKKPKVQKQKLLPNNRLQKNRLQKKSMQNPVQQVKLKEEKYMRATRILALFTALIALTGLVSAQEANPLTITGSVRPRTQLNIDDGTGYANLSSGPGGNTFIRFTNKLSNYSTMVLRFGAPYLDDKSGTAYDSADAASNSWITSVGVQDAYGTTDILGELGKNDIIGLKLQAGMFRLKTPMFSRGLNFGLGTGEDFSRSEVYGNYTFAYPGASFESYKWSLEIPFNVSRNVFPLSVKIGSDLDLTGKFQKTGFTGYAEIGGRNLYVGDDRFVIDWVMYYTLKERDAAPAGTPYIEGGKIAGGVVSLGFGFENGLSFGFGGAADYATYSYKAKWAGTATLREYEEDSLNWQAGMDVTARNIFKLYGAMMHRNLFDIDVGTVAAPKTPVNYAQNYVAFRIDLLPIKKLTPYFGGTYVLGYETIKDLQVNNKLRGEPATYDDLSWEAGLMWALTANVQLDGGYTIGANNAFSTFGAVINAIEQSEKGAVFFRAGWKF